jgi:phosphoglucomutase / phosphopentomutase
LNKSNQIQNFQQLNSQIQKVNQFKPFPSYFNKKNDFPLFLEGKSALNLAIKTANENKSSVILANDPDADRLAVAEKLKTGEWKVFNGNELGALLGWWAWHTYVEQNKERYQKDPKNFGKNVYMLHSTVSSQILQSIARVEGFNAEDTLTGFKWMGNRAHDLIKQNKTVLFCFEEAIGFMFGSSVLDKDGVSAESVFAEMANYLKINRDSTLNDQLEVIYKNYGFHVSNNSYFLCYERENIAAMFNKIRHFHKPDEEEYSVSIFYLIKISFKINNCSMFKQYPTECGPYKIDKIRDLNKGIIIDQKDNGKISKASLPSSSSSEMMTFYFTNGCTLTIRTSGTEPKIKWYSEMRQIDDSK